ncbi:hypothetical protein ICY_00598 [Bacillus cereus BAG2X1-3]|nr:hypothetical protein ICU_00745 [Bacillus cereus BAG2X1-1]EJS78060.1 hypothetical protein ICY_00598 [Bacillus cereus BAG2X1-3]
MHRHTGTNLEQIELVTTGKIIRIKNMNPFEIEQENSILQLGSPPWDTTLKQRGFEDVVHHFIECVQDNAKPITDGLEGLKLSKYYTLYCTLQTKIKTDTFFRIYFHYHFLFISIINFYRIC